MRRIYIIEQENGVTPGVWQTKYRLIDGTPLNVASATYVKLRDYPDNARYRHRYRLLECTVVGEGTYNGEER